MRRGYETDWASRFELIKLQFVSPVGLSGDRHEEQTGGMVVIFDAERCRGPEVAAAAYAHTLDAADVTAS
jgi:hypothetical protein